MEFEIIEAFPEHRKYVLTKAKDFYLLKQ